MISLKRRGRDILLLKTIILVVTCLSFLGILSCSTGTGSTASSGGTSGTSTGWTITVLVGTNPLPFNGTPDSPGSGSNTTAIMALVKDGTGAPAPNGTNICMTAVLNGFLKPGATELQATMCETTSNNIGQSIQTYQGKLQSGDDVVQVSSQGVIQRVVIHNVPQLN
jgi:hypothetical protein